VQLLAAGPGDITDRAEIARGFHVKYPGPPQPIIQRRIEVVDRHQPLELIQKPGQLLFNEGVGVNRYICGYPAGNDPVHQVAVAEQTLVAAERNLLEPHQLVEDEGKSGIVGNGADIAQMVGNPLPLQHERPQPGSPGRHLRLGQFFYSAAVGQAMGHGGIARDPACQPRPFLPGNLLETLLDPLVGVAEPLLQIEDILAHGLKTEMPRLDDPGMHRPDLDLVDPLSFRPDPLVLPGNPRHPLTGSKGFPEGPGVRRPILVLDPGTQIGMDMPGRQETEQAVDRPPETEGRDKEFRQAGKGRIINRELASQQQIVVFPGVAGKNRKSAPHEGLIDPPFGHQPRSGQFHHLCGILELLARYAELRSGDRTFGVAGHGSRAELGRYLVTESVHFRISTASLNQPARNEGRYTPSSSTTARCRKTGILAATSGFWPAGIRPATIGWTLLNRAAKATVSPRSSKGAR